MPQPQRAAPSAPFANRELNGDVLLEELSDLRSGQVLHRHLVECVKELRELGGARAVEAAAQLKALATGRFAAVPPLALLLTRWAGRLKADVDVPLLVGHFERLAMVGATLTVLRRSAERLPKGGRG
ncbi:MAG: hypothetical protein IPJ65_31415 [Archangiaceae bacterium]|nr:hypothetical protein [Archangiaceae bacterium]